MVHLSFCTKIWVLRQCTAFHCPSTIIKHESWMFSFVPILSINQDPRIDEKDLDLRVRLSAWLTYSYTIFCKHWDILMIFFVFYVIVKWYIDMIFKKLLFLLSLIDIIITFNDISTPNQWEHSIIYTMYVLSNYQIIF